MLFAACLLCLDLQGVAAANISVSPMPVTPTFLSERIADLSKATSKAIHQALRDAGLLDADGMLLKDPRWAACNLQNHVFGEPGHVSIASKASRHNVQEPPAGLGSLQGHLRVS